MDNHYELCRRMYDAGLILHTTGGMWTYIFPDCRIWSFVTPASHDPRAVRYPLVGDLIEALGDDIISILWLRSISKWHVWCRADGMSDPFEDESLWLALAHAWLAIHEHLTARDIGEMSKRRWEAKQAMEQAKPDDIDWSREGYPVSPMERNWMYCAAIHNKWYMDYRHAAKRPFRHPPHWMVGAVYPSSSLPINWMGSDALFHGCCMLQMNRNLAAKRPFPPRNQQPHVKSKLVREIMDYCKSGKLTAPFINDDFLDSMRYTAIPRHNAPKRAITPASEPYPWAEGVSLQGGHVVVVDNGHLDPVQRPYAGRVGIVDDDVTIGPVCVRFPEDGDVAQGYLRAFAVEKLRPAPHDFAIGDRVRVVSDSHAGDTWAVHYLHSCGLVVGCVGDGQSPFTTYYSFPADLLYLPPSAPAAKLPSFDDVLGIYKDCAKYAVGDFLGKGQTFGKVLSAEHDRTDGDAVHRGWSYRVRLGSGYACWWAEADVVKLGGAK